MTHRVRFLGALVAGATLLAGACDQQPTGPSGSMPTPSVSSLPQAAGGGQGVDQHALAQSFPAFGGFFLDQGVPTVFLTDPSQRGAVASALSGFLGARGFSPSDVQARQARFSYRQLEGFFHRASPAVFAGKDAVFADLDEAHNRVTLGVSSQDAAAGLRVTVARMGLPDGAVDVVLTDPIVPLASLQDRFDSIPAGVQIHFGNYLCSIGIIAQSGSQLGFVTASHCTNRQGGVEGTQYYQPLSSTDGNVIAVETMDPDYFRGAGCYRGSKCRYSDASFAAATGARDFALGKIAETTGPGSLTWSGGYWSVTAKGSGNGMQGATRSKVGRTTGYTTGTISHSCMDVGVSGSNIVLLCQDLVDAKSKIVGSGDSGSDVFAVSSGSNVTYWGGLWGGNQSGTEFVYSPASNIERELGTLTVVSGGSGGGGGGGSATLSASFTTSCHFGDCSFDASGSTGATSYDWDFGDGKTLIDAGPTVSHTYGVDGSYTVTLTATASDNTTDTSSHTVDCQTKGPHLQCK